MEVVYSNSGNFPKQRIMFFLFPFLLAGWNDDLKAGALLTYMANFSLRGPLTKDLKD